MPGKASNGYGADSATPPVKRLRLGPLVAGLRRLGLLHLGQRRRVLGDGLGNTADLILRQWRLAGFCVVRQQGGLDGALP